MMCPHDGRALEVRESEGAVGHGCSACQGMWLPGPYIAGLKHLPASFPTEKFYQILIDKSQGQAQLGCPAGCGSLTLANVGEVELDWCRRCNGVWFDRKELEKTLSLWTRRDPSRDWSSDIDILGMLIIALDL